MKMIITVAVLAVAILGCAVQSNGSRQESDAALLERGRYMVQIAGCNDCHTAGYALNGGQVEEKLWLMGDNVGWQGPWGTTYPANLRLAMQRMTEDQWLEMARTTELRPPMPWFALRAMEERDLRAIYRYIRSLPVAGELAPAYVPPGVEAPAPKFQFVLPPGH